MRIYATLIAKIFLKGEGGGGYPTACFLIERTGSYNMLPNIDRNKVFISLDGVKMIYIIKLKVYTISNINEQFITLLKDIFSSLDLESYFHKQPVNSAHI